MTKLMFVCLGTALGGGTLLIPLRAGTGGFFPFLLSIVVAFFMTLSAQVLLTKLLLAFKEKTDFIGLILKLYGEKIKTILALFYFVLSFSLVIDYTITIRNVILQMFSSFLGLDFSSNFLWPLVMVLFLVIVVEKSQKILIRFMGYATGLLIAIMFITSLALIPQWSFDTLSFIPPFHDFLKAFLQNIPMVVTGSLFFMPIPMVVNYYKKKNNPLCSQRIIYFSQYFLTFFIILFVSSFLMSLSRVDILAGIENKVTASTVLAMAFNLKKDNSIFVILPIIIDFLALTTSFWGTYLGAKESFGGLAPTHIKNTYSKYIGIILGVLIYIITMLNFSPISIIGVVIAPIASLIVFIIPFLLYLKIKDRLKIRWVYFVLLSGIFLISSHFLSLLL